MKIKVPKQIYTSTSITDYELLTYAALQKQSSTVDEETGYFMVFTAGIVYSLYGSDDVPQSILRNITSCIDSLIAKKIIIGEKRGNGKYIIAPADDFDDDFYAVINFAHVGTIVRSDFDRKGKLFRYVCYVLGSRNNNIEIDGQTGIVGTMSHGYFVEELDWSYDTVRHYSKVAEDLGIIYKVHTTNPTDGGAKTRCIYGAYEDRAAIDKYTDNTDGSKTAQQNEANRIRSIKAMKKELDAHPEKFDLWQRHKIENRYKDLMEKESQDS